MRKQSLRKSLALSLAIHTLFLLFSWLAVYFTPPPPQIVEMDFVEQMPTKTKEEMAKQIVEQDDKSLNNEIDENAKFLSKNNQKVIKQTMARNRGEFKNSANQNPGVGSGGPKKQLTLNDLKPKLDIGKAMDQRLQQEKKFEADAEAAAQNPKQAQRQVSADRPGQNGAPASQTNDYVKDVDQSNETLLSTREFVYYTYYARIRRQLNQHWGPKVREKLTRLFSEGRTIASTDDKITKVLITLDRKGTLVKVQILSDSGIRDLDEAAVEAFKAAAPFPNPPGGIVDPDGTIKIRWDFILEA